MPSPIDAAPTTHTGSPSRYTQHMAPISEWDFERVLLALRRRRRIVIGCVLVGLAMGLVYLVVAAPRYSASVQMFIDTPRVKAVADVTETSAASLDTGAIDTQVEVLKSERVVAGLVNQLGLKNNPSFQPKKALIGDAIRSAIDFITAPFTSNDAPSDLETAEADRLQMQRIVGTLSRSIAVKRLGRTSIVELKFTGDDPATAAMIANGWASQYLVDQLDARYDATTRAAKWLQDRIGELRERSLSADMKVQQFRTKNGLIAVNGKLVDETQLQVANEQLSDARAKMAEAEAKANRITSIIESGNVDGVVSESLANTVISGLRTKYLEASKREAEISKKLGPDHIAAVNLRNEMKQYERLLFEELGRIGESYRSDYQIAKARLESLQENLKSMMALTANNNETLVTLRELERESETYKTLYSTFLTRYQEAIQQQSFPITDARVISAAYPPEGPSWPNKPLIMALSLIVGLTFGGISVLVLENRDSTFRTGSQIQQELNIEFLGLLPLIERDKKTIDPMNYVLAAPLSGFAETLRASKVSADIALRARHPKIIGVVSVMPGEGKTTVSKNFASLVSKLSSRTILIDGDLRNPGLTRSLYPDATIGLAEVLQGSVSLSAVVQHEAESGLAILPAVTHRNLTNSSELLSSTAMRKLLATLGESYDYVIMDLPPIGPVIDVRAIADIIDAFVFVIEWGKTSRVLVRSTLETEPEVLEKCLGVVLNKVDVSKIGEFEGNEYRNYAYSKYSKYYLQN